MIDLIFTRSFSMAHRLLSGLSPKCASQHGHTETVEIELRPIDLVPLDGTTNMICEFGRAKSAWHRFIDDQVDHSLQISRDDPLLPHLLQNEPPGRPRLMVTPGDPTTELTALLLAAKCSAFIAIHAPELTLNRLTLRETPTNAVRIYGEWRRLLPADGEKSGWWNRADDSINDLPDGATS